jgi:hypothetical protein
MKGWKDVYIGKKDGRWEGWKGGRIEGWKDVYRRWKDRRDEYKGWKEGRKDGRMEKWKGGRMEGWGESEREAFKAVLQ